MQREIEEKWRREWDSLKCFEGSVNPGEQSLLATMPFPYMNGPLHIGHAFTATRVDVYARYKRMKGLNVLFPWAWHWTGQPIVAAAERLSNGDPAMIREFVEIDKISKSELSKFYDPRFMAQYYTDSGREALKRLGLSIDWRREFHTTELEPNFNKFVLWQYNKLREKGFVKKGTHPVVWCPRDQSPTGDHDRLSGEGVTWEEFTLVKFEYRDSSAASRTYLPAATFRPETIFGVTNLWLNPDAKYLEIEVDGKENWIVSLQASKKLENQLRKIVAKRELSGAELIGRIVLSPLDPSRKLIILPADFVDPNNGSGVVYSVPAHAPADYIALRDLRSDSKKLQQYQIEQDQINKIEPIPLVNVPGMGKFPAIETVEKLHIKDQNDPMLHQATEEVYRKEFHQGVLNENCGQYRGKKVSEVKGDIISYLKLNGFGDSMYDLPEKVVCRCMTECIVKVLEDQWFLTYSDSSWKKLAHECVNSANVYPESARQWFHDVIDWLKDWPCARRVGLGTPLPWSPGWIVETLSDSTIYMCYYTIDEIIKREGIKPEQLTEAVFDYVFLGKGETEYMSRESKISEKLLRSMREEFLYWYPVRLRNSAKELIPNHLTFFIFQHVAFFARELWPTGISANGMVAVDGVKMSKSKGNVIPLRDALDDHGADTLRAALVNGAEGIEDLDWRGKYVSDIKTRLDSFAGFIFSLHNEAKKAREHNKPYSQADLWFESQIQRHISKISSSLDMMRTKTAFQEAFFNYWISVRRYLSRSDKYPTRLLEYATSTWIKLLSPFIPFTCDEIFSKLGHVELASQSRYPEAEPPRIHIDAEVAEFLVERLVQDVQNITKLLPTKAMRLFVYIAEPWKYKLFYEEIRARKSGRKTSELLQQFFSAEPSIPKKQVADTLPRITKAINELGEDFQKKLLDEKFEPDERLVYEADMPFLTRELGGLEIKVVASKDPAIYDPKGKSRNSLPFKPALYLE